MFASNAQRFCGEQQLDREQCQQFTADARVRYIAHRRLRHPPPEGRGGQGAEGSGAHLLLEDDGFFQFLQGTEIEAEQGRRRGPGTGTGAGAGADQRSMQAGEHSPSLVVVVSGSPAHVTVA